MEAVTLLLFCFVLILCVLLDYSVVYALVAGLAIFLGYGRLKKHSWRALFAMAFSKVKTVRNILVIYVLIGMVTALWRAGGTIPTIIFHASAMIQPSLIVLLTFLLNCAISILTGTGVGTAATMGALCMALASTVQVNPMYIGGAMLAGCYFGDRWSPVSTGALLVSELTGTDLYTNLKKMFLSALPAFLISCPIYYLLGRSVQGTSDAATVCSLFSQHFDLHWFTVLPAGSILILAALRFPMKTNLAVSIVLSLFCCLLIQNWTAGDLLRLVVLGYYAPTTELAAILNGGGIISMARVIAIITLSSSYTGIFEGTGLLNNLQRKILALSQRITPYGSIILTSTIACMIACNQTMAIMLTHQLCRDVEPDKQKLAIDLEDSVVVIAPLIPWSIACAVPLTTIGAPTSSILFAFFLYLIPIFRLFGQGTHRIFAAKRLNL